MRFKAGDKVRITDKVPMSSSDYARSIGKIGEVQSVSNGIYPYTVLVEGEAYAWLFRAEEVESISPIKLRQDMAVVSMVGDIKVELDDIEGDTVYLTITRPDGSQVPIILNKEDK